METPASLLERLRQPAAEEAWGRFVRLYTPFIYMWARGAGLQPADAADLVQDVLASLIQSLPRFSYDQHKSFRAWLRTVTVNKWRDRCRRLATRPLGALAEPEEVAEPPGPDSFAEVEYRQQLVARAIELMQADFQPATWKAFWELVVNGRPAADIARELNLSPNAIYLARGRVLQRLRQELDGLVE